jgi:hypothetical protein
MWAILLTWVLPSYLRLLFPNFALFNRLLYLGIVYETTGYITWFAFVAEDNNSTNVKSTYLSLFVPNNTHPVRKQENPLISIKFAQYHKN